MRALLLLLLLAAPAGAQERKLLDAEGFEALLTGRTITYGQPEGPPRGIETYFPGRRVTWLWVDSGECLSGTWYQGGTEALPEICFLYPDDPDSPFCFQYWREGRTLFSDAPEGGSQEVSDLDADLDAVGCEWLGA